MEYEKIKSEIEKKILNNDVVLFMKGTQHMPQCGFSATVVAILNKLHVNYLDVNVLEDNDLREAIKTYSDWPTIPQLYLKGEFVGGCDIVKELYQNGELENMLEAKVIKFSK